MPTLGGNDICTSYRVMYILSSAPLETNNFPSVFAPGSWPPAQAVTSPPAPVRSPDMLGKEAATEEVSLHEKDVLTALHVWPR